MRMLSKEEQERIVRDYDPVWYEPGLTLMEGRGRNIITPSRTHVRSAVTGDGEIWLQDPDGLWYASADRKSEKPTAKNAAD